MHARDAKPGEAGPPPANSPRPRWHHRPQITKMARKGLTPSQIGVLLRDQSGVPQIASITGGSARPRKSQAGGVVRTGAARCTSASERPCCPLSAGTKVLRILRATGLAPELPEDLYQ
jgi:small subunit ribosomal protein S13e